MPRITIKQINTAIRSISGNHTSELVRGDGYFYFAGELESSWPHGGVYVPRLGDLSLDEWVEEYRSRFDHDQYEPKDNPKEHMSDDYFNVEGDSITASPVGFNLAHITIFNPTPETREALRNLKPNEYIGPMRLIDKFDNGETDAHVSSRHHHFVNLIMDERKHHTIILTVKTTFWE